MTDNVIEIGSKVKVAVVCLPGLESFLPDIVHKLEEDYDVQTCYSGSMDEVATVIAWCDIVWCEWANEICVHLTNEVDLTDKQVIVRLHSYEALSGYCVKINWRKVSALILVAQHIKDLLPKQGIKLPTDLSTYIIPNGVDTNKFRRIANE